MIPSEVMRVKLTFIDDILGTAAGDPDIHGTYIASKVYDEDGSSLADKKFQEEVESIGVDGVTEKGKTVFSRTPDGEPCLWSYQIRGFFKSACGALRQVDGTESKKVKAYKKLIDQRVLVFPDAKDKEGRMIPIKTEEEMGECQRPLRAQTMQGERVAIADSEAIRKKASIEFDIEMIGGINRGLIEEWLDYGVYNGLGQWRNSGKGAFTWEEVTA